jgi:hypothetical protein
LRADLPPELEQAIAGCLTKKADDRITLVALARALAKLAPERSSGLLGRIEATAAPADAKGRASSSSGAETIRRHDAATSGPASAKDVPTESTVQRREARRGSGRRMVVLAAVAGAGVVAGAWYTGHLHRRDLRSDVVGAGGAVVSAASAVSAAASAMASAVASSLPEPPAPPSASAAPAPSASADDEAEDETPHPANPAGGAPLHGPAKPAPAKPHPATKPHHGKTWHRSHTQQ